MNYRIAIVLLLSTLFMNQSFAQVQVAADEPKRIKVAGENFSDSVLRLETMAVTAVVDEATVGDTQIKEMPFASTVINQDEIKRLKFVNPDELLDRIPGETLVRNLRIPAGDKSYTIPLIDGAALGNPLQGATQDFGTDVNANDIERIEIIKGPTSALFHNNALGGVINVITKGSIRMPDQKTRIWGEVGNHNRYRTGLSTQGTLNNAMGYLLDYNYWDIGAFRDQSRITNLGEESIRSVGQKRHQASAKFIFHPDEDSSLIIRGSYLNDKSVNPGELLQSEFDENKSQVGSQNGFFTNLESYLGSGIYKRQMSENGELTVNFTFRRVDEAGVSRFGGANNDIDTDINGKVMYRHDFDFMDANIIFGADVFHTTADDINPNENPARVTREFAETNIYSGFTQIQFTPIENLKITGGFRHESIDVNVKQTTADGTRISQGKSFSATLPKAGVSYDITKRHRIWFAYGQGFLVPNTGQLYTASRGRANSNLRPEESEHFEVGLRGTVPLFGSALKYDTSYYNQTIKDFVVASQLPAQPTQNLNAGKVNIQGVESVLEYQPNQYVRFGVTHTFARNLFRRFIDGDGVDLSGNELSRSPHHHINARIAVMPITGLAIELGIDSVTSYSTNHNERLDNRGRFSRGERINLRVTYDKGPMEVWFHALNIGNVKEDRVGFNTRARQRSIRTVDGLQLYGGAAYNF